MFNNELTIYIIKAGHNPNYKNCRLALEKQTMSATIKEIVDIAPMSKAFQQMIDDCTTKYFIQVDQDMVLNTNAVENLYRGMICQPENIIIYGKFLRDPHLEMDICGVKIYKTDIIKKYPYNLNSNSCEVEQIKRYEADGYKTNISIEVVGTHSPEWSEELIFERYFTLMEKSKEFKYTWTERIPNKLYEKFKKDPSKINLQAFLGAYTSLINKDMCNTGEKVYTDMKKSQYGLLEGYLTPPNRGTLYLTSKCNFNCSWCRRQTEYKPTAKDMTADTIDLLLHKFPSIKSLCLCGYGEPFMHPELSWIIKHLNNKKIYTGLITNGSLIESRWWELQQNGLPNYISISLNASNSSIHKSITGTDTFDTIISGIRRINNCIPVYLSYVCTKSNQEDIPAFLALAKSLPITGVHLHNLLPHVNGADDYFNNNVYTKDDIGIINKWKQLPDASIVKSYPILIEKNKISRNCMSPWKALAIDGNGDISICNSLYPCDSKNGNIKDSIIWNNDYCKDMRIQLLEKQLEGCSRCFRNWEDTE